MASRTISTTAELLFPPNRLRKSFVIQNEDATINAFIKFEKQDGTSVTTTDHDHRVTAGASLSLNYQNDGLEAIQGRWTVIAASGTPRISFFETEDNRR